MRAVVCRAFGSPNDLELAEVEAPSPGAGDAVVRVEAAGVNFADLLMVAGRYQVRPALPFVPGSEFVGTVAQAGPDSGLSPGDRVIGAPEAGGAFAELACVPASRLFKVPMDLPAELAAGLLIGHGTAAYALERGGLRAGETVLVTGAGGGVGIAAVEVASRMGARVIAAAGSPGKLAAARAHGATETICYATEAIAEAAKTLTDGRGVDVVLDTVGGEVFDAALRATARHARVLVVGFAGGVIPRIPAEYLLIKNLRVEGVGFGATLVEDPSRTRAVLDRLLELHARAPFEPQVGGRFGLEDAGKALRLLADRAVTGKLLVIP